MLDPDAIACRPRPPGGRHRLRARGGSHGVLRAGQHHARKRQGYGHRNLPEAGLRPRRTPSRRLRPALQPPPTARDHDPALPAQCRPHTADPPPHPHRRSTFTDEQVAGWISYRSGSGSATNRTCLSASLPAIPPACGSAPSPHPRHHGKAHCSVMLPGDGNPRRTPVRCIGRVNSRAGKLVPSMNRSDSRGGELRHALAEPNAAA